MKNIAKTVFSFVFSFPFMMAVAFVMLIFVLAVHDEARIAADKTCYSRAMVVVETRAGLYCVDLTNLVAIK